MSKPATFQLPAATSTFAGEIDWLYYFIYWSSLVFFIAIMGVMLWFIVRYRRRQGQDGAIGAPTEHATKLELFWTFAPLIFLFFLFDWGFKSYVKASVAPAESITVRVRGMQWNWEFEYDNGMVQLNELLVPVDTPVRLVMSSSDVIHSFFVPEFRIKKDVVPGMFTTQWFEATEKKEVQVFCTEYCGAPEGKEGNVGHSAMLAKVKVVSRKEYDDFLANGPAMPEGMTPVAWGESLYKGNQCNACHGIDGVSQQPAPNFKGLWGRQENLADGNKVQVDENYLKESILYPQKKIVAGYSQVQMPMFRLPDRQLDALIAYIKTLE